MDEPPYRCVYGDVANMDEEATFDVSPIVVDTGWEIKSDLVMFNNPNEYCREKFVGNSKESGKGVCVGVLRGGIGSI